MTTALLKRGLALVGCAALAACGDSTGVPGAQNVSVNFRVIEAPSTPAQAPGGPALAVGVDGSNGTLTLDRILLLVNEAELKPSDGSCDNVTISDPTDHCPEFEAPPRFLDLPLDGQPIDAITAAIPPGEYKELEFEVEDLEDDEEDPAMAAAIDDVREQVLAQVSDWPLKASAMVEGTFQPVGGTPEPFRVFIDAEIEVEMQLVPSLLVTEDGSTSRSLTVDVRPDLWFMMPDGSVRDLREWDYAATQLLLPLEVEMEEGFFYIEIDR